jgi:hypothetical protein
MISRTGQCFGVGGGSEGQFGHPAAYQRDATPIRGSYPTGISHITTNRNVTVMRVGMKQSWAGSEMLKLLQSDNYKDCLLTSAESGASLHVHRILIAARTHFGVQPIPRMIECGNVSQAGLQVFAEWLYGDALGPNSLEHKEDLLSLAALFQDDRLGSILKGELSLGESLLEQELANTVGRFPELSDFAIDCGDGSEPIMAHKVLLSRCPYFQTLFESEFNESLKGKVSISDANINGMVHLLRYVYSDAVDKDMDVNDCIDTLLCCNALLLPDLKLRMELEIMKNVDLDSAAFVFNVAFVSGAEKLQAVAVNILKRAPINPLSLANQLEDEEVRTALRDLLKREMSETSFGSKKE